MNRTETVAGPVDVSYVEPTGWVSPPEHCATAAEARRLRAATDLLAGRAAASRRTWRIAPCACGEEGGR